MERQPQPPSVPIFMTDQWRYDACGCYGSAICRTRNLDRLAGEGMRFTNAYTSTPVCTPARASFWTGLWPNHHGMLINTHWKRVLTKPRLDDDVPTLSQLLKAAGYRTAHFGKWYVGPDSEMARCGFEHVATYGDFRRHLQETGAMLEVRREIVRPYMHSGYTFAGVSSAEDEQLHETWLCARAAESIRAQARAREPFFCVVSTPGPHPGYVVPASHAALYDPADVALWPNLHDGLDGKPSLQRMYRDGIDQGGTLSDDEWRICIARYCAFATLIDAGLGRLLDLLDDLGLAQDTLVVFCTDDGDLIGAHGLFDKGPFMYDEQMHVPLVVRWPGRVAAGAVCEAMVTSLMDLMPTLAEAAGLTLPRPVDARSLMPLLRNGQVEEWDDDVYCQYDGNAVSLYSLRGLRRRRYKYVYHPFDLDELYDEQADPWELHNLSQDPGAAPLLAEMRARLVRWMERVEDPLLGWTVKLGTQ